MPTAPDETRLLDPAERYSATDDALYDTGPSVYRFDHDEIPAPPEVHEITKTVSPTSPGATTLRLKPNTLAHMANRDGDHFTVLEQSDGAPMLRDFPSAIELVEYLKSQTGFRALLAPDSVEGLEMQRSATRSRYRENRTDSDSDASSSTSTASTLSGILPAKVMWIDIQTSDHDIVEAVLSLFPRIETETVEDLKLQDAPDTVHWFSSHRYLFANIECDKTSSSNSTFSLTNQAARFSTDVSTILSIIAFSDVFITVHACPIAGHREALQALHEVVSARTRYTTTGGSMKLTANNTSKRSAQLVPDAKPPVHAHTIKKKKRLTVGIILSTVIESTVIASLPDPTVCLAEVDRIDEMVLLVTQDQHDLLRRIARTRRELSTQRAKLYRKERFLQTFTTPALRASFVSATMGEQYRHLLGEVFHVAERLEAARDALTQANSNFVSHISLQVSQTSNHMNTKMKALSQVATICMPLNIITGLMGMNVTVPYNTTAYPDTLVPFGVVLSIMGLFLLIGIPLVWQGLIRDRHIHSQSEGMVTVAIDD